MEAHCRACRTSQNGIRADGQTTTTTNQGTVARRRGVENIAVSDSVRGGQEKSVSCATFPAVARCRCLEIYKPCFNHIDL